MRGTNAVGMSGLRQTTTSSLDWSGFVMNTTKREHERAGGGSKVILRKQYPTFVMRMGIVIA
jgi:hypothetical protein